MKDILRIIPKLDIKGPNMVKGVNLEGLRALGSPRDFIEYYYNNFADELIYHDVVASLYLRNNLRELLKKTSKNIFIPITAGGGIRSERDVQELISSGADRIFINTSALNKPDLIKQVVTNFGSSTILISIESIFYEGSYYCSKDFGREKTNIKVEEWIKQIQDFGAGEIILTSVNKEGTGTGFDLNLASKITNICKIPYIINGGFGKKSHINELLNVCNPSGIAISSAFHYNLGKSFSKINKNEGNFEFIENRKNYLNFEPSNIKDLKSYVKNLQS